MNRNDDQPIQYFECSDCQQSFAHGSQGDNEKYCLRCQHIGALNVRDEYAYYDQFSNDE